MWKRVLLALMLTALPLLPVAAQEGQALIDWLLSAEGQAAIKSFQINGEQQFFPNAAPTG